MPKIQQTVTFTDSEIKSILINKAMEQIKEETGKGPTGSSTINLTEDLDGDRTKKGEHTAVVTFNCNGKR